MSDQSPGPAEPQEKLSARPHMIYFLCVALTVSFLVWAAVGTLDIVSIATGEVIPSTQVKTVQHLEGGIVEQILVREGQRVQKNQPLVVLEPTASTADVGELKVRLTSLAVEIQSLESQLQGLSKPNFDQTLRNAHPRIVSQAERSYAITRARFESELDRQDKSIQQVRQSINEINARLKNRRNSLKFVLEQIDISNELLRDNLTNRYKHIDLLKERSELEGSIEEDKAALNVGRAAFAQAEAERRTIISTFDDENQKLLDEARTNFDELSQRMQKFEDSLKRTTLRSPVDGVVKQLYVVTIGGVVKAGEPVADIVPEGDRLIVEAKLQTQDIGFVQPGQEVTVKLASADAARFGGLDGTVISVSPDTILSPDGIPFYRVRIETEKAHFEQGNSQYSLFPGMQVIANIRTGTRTVADYLIGPYGSSLKEAMRER